FLKVSKSLPVKQRISLHIKRKIFKYLLKNTNYIFLQTESIQKEFKENNPGFSSKNTLVLPFYEPLNYPESVIEKNTFIYVSGGSPHKNHQKLLKGFSLFFDKHKT